MIYLAVPRSLPLLGTLRTNFPHFAPRRVAPKRLQLSSKINLLEVGSVFSVPLGTFPGMPLPLAFQAAASPLPISKTQIRSKPLAPDPAGSLFGLILSFHRFLRRSVALTSRSVVLTSQVTLRKQWQYFFQFFQWGKKVGGSLKPVGEKIKQRLGGSAYRCWVGP